MNILDGLIGWWTFDADSGVDSSGQGNNGTLFNSPPFVDGKISRSISFDGLTQYMTASIPVTITDFTLSFWVYQLAWGSSGSTILVFKFCDTSFYVFSFGAYRVVDGPFGCNPHTFGSSSSFLGAWVHFAFVHQYQAASILVYRNGVYQTTGSRVGSGSAGPPNPFRLNNNISIERDLRGYMDDLRLYNRPLSATDVQLLYAWPYWLSMDRGTFALTGSDCDLDLPSSLACAAGAFTLSGKDIRMFAPSLDRTWRIPAENRVLRIPAEDRVLRIPAENRTWRI